MNGHSQCKSMSEKILRTRINQMLWKSLGTSGQFVPKNVTAELKRWLLSLEMTGVERQVAERLTKGILTEYERRLRWVCKQLEQDVFKPFGGD